MIKIVVVQKDFYIGGIPSSCINFLNILSESMIFKVTLITFTKIDKIKLGISDKIDIIYTNKSLEVFALTYNQCKSKNFPFRLKWIMVRLWSKYISNNLPLKIALKKQKPLEEEFDIAISFAPSSSSKTFSVGSSELVLNKIRAKTKCVLYHNDFTMSGLNTGFVVDGLSRFDKILCVSKSCAEIMRNALPQLKDKIDHLYNFANVSQIKDKSQEFKVVYPKSFNIVSVSRLSEEKGHIR